MADSETPLANSVAAPHEPPHTYTANNGYGASVSQEVPRSLGAQSQDAFAVEEEDEDDLEDIFDDEDDFGNADTGDITKNYNRQRQFQDGGVALLPKSNQQKPAANTFASVDDQISALSKHAAKIRLDDVKEGQVREKDKADRATSEQVLDQRTRMILLQMINRGFVSEVHGAISTGKEANVYGAVAFPDINGPPVHRAVKVYKTAILSFKDRERYITGEHRFKSGADKGNSRKMVKLWAEKEFRNLRRIHAAGIPCPEPIQLKLHVLVMEFLGDRRGWAYPRLRDASIPSDDVEQLWTTLYVQLLGMMRRMYQVCKLVHADLSEYNILYNDKRLYIIDVSQSVEHDHPRSLEFLRMDIKNTGDFFRKQGVDTLSDRTVFDFITAPEGPVEEPGTAETIKLLYTSRSSDENDDKALAQIEVDNEVFRNQYIPQTLDQVYDIEKDAQKIGDGEGDQLVYRNLLADQAVLPKDPNAEGDEAEGADSSGDSGDGAALDSDDSEDESRFAKGTPRGKRFEDKEEKKQHKQAVKEEKREKRKDKMPKHLKKKLVSSSSRKKK
ncbi:RIO1 family-domain-containing protein [Pseudomassariella vexata]|uniref:Serine/threonine-protein kinase RIO1 n=1 Tax=Pseudomassariella vexata TaxID=1141098 RepID=A0A1Y2EA30_9PEZI|nr:RIO1 family-domain-containing protein [Pseudomassariella vexata]ORY68402.1 RIO1 family-domain-containing protein [Pseudomassariella vexata]